MVESNASDIEIQPIVEAEQSLAAAHLQLDLHTIDKLLHQDYVIIQPGGLIETKAQVLASYATDTRHWDTAEVDQLDIRLYGQTAVVIGRWRASGRHGPEPFAYEARFLSIWVQAEGRWQNVAYQSAETQG